MVLAWLLLGLLPQACGFSQPYRRNDGSHQSVARTALRAEATFASTRSLDDAALDEHHCRAEVPSTMVPLTQPPLLLLQSSEPVISREGCALLSRYFEHRATGKDDACTLTGSQMHLAEELLREIHEVIDRVTNCPRHGGEMRVPRYVRYDSTLLLDPRRFGEALLPDGLHVDTNNGKLFRHITAILYLTDNEDGLSADGSCFMAGGGTTFPLATSASENCFDKPNVMQGAAQRLLESDIQHTKGDTNEANSSEGRILEKCALDSFHKVNAKDLTGFTGQYNNQYETSRSEGVRVMPEAGKLIYFHNVDDDGMPDALSFHGGEELLRILRDGKHLDELRADAQTKCIVVFFKEVPISAFRDTGREGFAEQARKARSWTKETYY